MLINFWKPKKLGTDLDSEIMRLCLKLTDKEISMPALDLLHYAAWHNMSMTTACCTFSSAQPSINNPNITLSLCIIKL